MSRVIVAFVLLLAGCGGTGPSVPTPRIAPDTPMVVPDLPPLGDASDVMRVHFVDVGQGDAILLELPCGVVLVDTGGEGSRDKDGARDLSIYLDAFFAARPALERTIDLLVLTHPHIDHVRGAPEVLEKFRVLRIVDNGQDGGEPADRPVRSVRRFIRSHEGGPDAVAYEAIALADIPEGRGLTDELLDPFVCGAVDPKIQALWGRIDSSLGWGEDFDNENNHSIVLRVDFGEASMLLLGDLEDVAQVRLVERYQSTGLLDVDLYKVGHHGSHNGTTDELIGAMTPAISVIEMGVPSRHDDWTAYMYGHPRRKAVALLDAGSTCTRTPAQVLVASRVRTFAPATMSHAVYGTGWDGTVVVEANADGHLRVVVPVGEAPCVP